MINNPFFSKKRPVEPSRHDISGALRCLNRSRSHTSRPQETVFQADEERRVLKNRLLLRECDIRRPRSLRSWFVLIPGDSGRHARITVLARPPYVGGYSLLEGAFVALEGDLLHFVGARSAVHCALRFCTESAEETEQRALMSDMR